MILFMIYPAIHCKLGISYQGKKMILFFARTRGVFVLPSVSPCETRGRTKTSQVHAKNKIIFFPRYERYFFAREAENWQEMATSPARRTPGAGKREEVCCVLFLIEEAVSAAVWRSSKKNRGKMLNYSQYFNNECTCCVLYAICKM